MKKDLLFSNFPFISNNHVTLSRITDLDLNSLWEILGNEDNFEFLPESALKISSDARYRLMQIESKFRDKRSVTLGIYSNVPLNKPVGTLDITDINRSPIHIRPCRRRG